MHYSIWCMLDFYLYVFLTIYSSRSFQIFFILLSLVLDDGRCLNSFLQVDIFISTSHILLWDRDLELFVVPWEL
jgi:hypothetical protein